jgi:hypothetical protein
MAAFETGRNNSQDFFYKGMSQNEKSGHAQLFSFQTIHSEDSFGPNEPQEILQTTQKPKEAPAKSPKKNSLLKLLQDFHLSPKPKAQENIEVEEYHLPPVETKKKKEKPQMDLFKDLLQQKKSIQEPATKLCDKYGICLSRVIGKGTTANVRLVVGRDKIYAVKVTRSKSGIPQATQKRKSERVYEENDF